MLNIFLRLFPRYTDVSRFQKFIILLSVDFLVSIISIFCAFLILDTGNNRLEIFSFLLPLTVGYSVFKVLVLLLFGLYKPIVKYTDLSVIIIIFKAILSVCIVTLLILPIFNNHFIYPSVIIIDGLITIVGIVFVRLSIKKVIQYIFSLDGSGKQKEKIVIYGAGGAGYQLAQSLEQNFEYDILGFVDDNPEMHGRLLIDKKIYSPKYLESLYQETPFQAVIFAIPCLSPSRRKEIIMGLKTLPVQFKTIPTFTELLSNQAGVSQLKTISIADLLGREEITPDEKLFKINITNKNVLVTGAGGSIGSELCRQIIQLQPNCLVLLELNEFALYTIEMELQEQKLNIPIYAYLGNITDRDDFERILKLHNIETVYHAAAYKHVPLVEANASVGVYNNVAGTLRTAQSAIACGVKNYVLISTDKAVRPTNVMGTSKRIAELLTQALASQDSISTTFAIVRFGNVLNSSGSVIPRFRKQINEGKPITLTHKDITRYFISIPEAVSLVIQAGAMAKGGEIFLLDMGEPVKIYDLAVKMIELSGLIPDKDIPINIVGLRPGEKLYEELLIDEENSYPSEHPKIFYGKEPMINWEELQPNLENLLNQCQEKNSSAVVEILKFLVPEYKPNNCSVLKNE